MVGDIYGTGIEIWAGFGPNGQLSCLHGLRTPNEGINQRNLKIWADVADKNMLRLYLKIWEW